MRTPLIVGLGSHHGDDQVGWLILDKLRQRGFPSERLLRLRHPAELLDIEEADRCETLSPEQSNCVSNVAVGKGPLENDTLVVCDACRGNQSPGAIQLMNWPDNHVVYQRCFGSHDLSFCDVMELGKTFHRLPGTVQVWVVEAGNVSSCGELSPEVALAAERVAESIWMGLNRA